jgi:diadenosine tetraphosphate (Ap4A) HIT family hydrolase
MNLFPYNTGHMLIVPNLRVASPEELPDNMLHDLADQVPLALSAARRALAPHAFNIGFNLGEDAGAGIAAHLHQHVVPRWRGDANFLPVVSGTKVLPELLPVNAARIREELMRSSTATFRARVLDRTCDRMLVDPDGQPPIILTDDDKPVWNTAVDAAACFRTTARLTGLHRRDGDITLTLDGDEIDKPQLGAIWIPAEKFQSLS